MPAEDFENFAGVFEDEEIEVGAFVEGRVKIHVTAHVMVRTRLEGARN